MVIKIEVKIVQISSDATKTLILKNREAENQIKK